MRIKNKRVILDYKIWKSTNPVFKIDRDGLRLTVFRYIFSEKTISGYESIDIDEVSNQIISQSHINNEDLYDKEYLFGFQHLKKEDNSIVADYLKKKQAEVLQTIKELGK